MFRRGTRLRAVDGVSLSIDKGQTLGLVGESGCGKTSVGKAITRLVPAASGHVVVDGVDLLTLKGEELRRARRNVQMIFQDPYLSLDPRRTIGELVAEPLDNFGVGSRAERRKRVEELLSLVGLNPMWRDRRPHRLSGGQRQRIGIARALALEPALIVADEAISALDVSIQAQITNLLQELQESLDLTYLYIAHDLAVVRHISHRVAVMYLGKLVEVGDTEVVFAQPAHPYTRALLSSVGVPDPSPTAQPKRVSLTGEVPSAADPPAGCRFHTRCWLRPMLGNPSACQTTEPALVKVGDFPSHASACHFIDAAQTSDPSGAATALVGLSEDQVSSVSARRVG